MLEKLRIIFTIPGLRRKIFLTLFLLAIYRVGWQIPLPMIDQQQMSEFATNMAGSNLGDFMAKVSVFSAQPVESGDHFRLGDHALYFGLDHSAAAGHGLQTAGRTQERRGSRPQKDQ